MACIKVYSEFFETIVVSFELISLVLFWKESAFIFHHIETHQMNYKMSSFLISYPKHTI